MASNLLINEIHDLHESGKAVRQLMQEKTCRKKNWRILSIWRELRKHKIKYYFLSQNQIVIHPIPFRRGALIISVQKINVPGANFSIDYYTVRQFTTNNSVELPSSTGQQLIRKLLKFSFLLPDEVDERHMTNRYEPYQYCPVCGERTKIIYTLCDSCGTKLP